jgi:hypothetical protein
MDNPETQAILGTRHRTKTKKKKNGQPRVTGNIRHKKQDEDTEKKEWTAQRHRQY